MTYVGLSLVCLLPSCTTMIDPVTGQERQMVDPATATGIAIASGIAAGAAGYAIGNNNGNNNGYYNDRYYNNRYYNNRYYRNGRYYR